MFQASEITASGIWCLVYKSLRYIPAVGGGGVGGGGVGRGGRLVRWCGVRGGTKIRGYKGRHT